MPSPIGHALGGLIVGLALNSRTLGTLGPLATLACAAVLPDLDFLWGRHNMETHSLGAAVIAGLATLAGTRGRNPRLAVAVTLNMQRERPGVDSPAAGPLSPAAEEDLKPKVETQLRPAAKQTAKEMSVMQRREAGQLAPAAPTAPVAASAAAAHEPQPFTTNQAAGSASGRADDSRRIESSVTGALARQVEERTSRDAEAAALAPRLGAFQAKKEASAEANSPERELDRIAQLRTRGQHEEADRALAEFRRRHPDYRIPDAMRERVERR